jgi:hypothetical protein
MFDLIWLHLHWYQKRLLQYEKANNNNGRTMHKAKSSHGIWPGGLKNERTSQMKDIKTIICMSMVKEMS